VTHLEKNLDSYKKALQNMSNRLGLSDAEIEAALKVVLSDPFLRDLSLNENRNPPST
jgi:hypothetical protein